MNQGSNGDELEREIKRRQQAIEDARAQAQRDRASKRSHKEQQKSIGRDFSRKALALNIPTTLLHEYALKPLGLLNRRWNREARALGMYSSTHHWAPIRYRVVEDATSLEGWLVYENENSSSILFIGTDGLAWKRGAAAPVDRTNDLVRAFDVDGRVIDKYCPRITPAYPIPERFSVGRGETGTSLRSLAELLVDFLETHRG